MTKSTEPSDPWIADYLADLDRKIFFHTLEFEFALDRIMAKANASLDAYQGFKLDSPTHRLNHVIGVLGFFASDGHQPLP